MTKTQHPSHRTSQKTSKTTSPKSGTPKKRRTTPKYKQHIHRVIFLWILITVIVLGTLGFVVFKSNMSFMEGMTVPVEDLLNKRRATNLKSMFRLEGQKRDEYIKSQDINTGRVDVGIDESMIYMQEYNLMGKQATIRKYTNDDGEELFAGYNPGKLTMDKLRRTNSVRYRIPTIRSNATRSYYSSASKNSNEAIQAFMKKNSLVKKEESDRPAYLSSRYKTSSRETFNTENSIKTIESRDAYNEAQEAKEADRGVLTNERSVTPSSNTTNSRIIRADDSANDIVKININGQSVSMTEYLGLQEAEKDTIPPTVRLEKQYNDRVYGGGYRVFVYFSEVIQDFDEYDLQLQNVKLERFRRIGTKTFYIDLSVVSQDKESTLTIRKESVADEARNKNKYPTMITL